MAYSEPTRNESIAVGTTVVLISSAPSIKRKVIYLRNTGAVAVTIALSPQAAVLNAGIVLGADNFIIDSSAENYECYQGDITAISSGAGTTVAIYER